MTTHGARLRHADRHLWGSTRSAGRRPVTLRGLRQSLAALLGRLVVALAAPTGHVLRVGGKLATVLPGLAAPVCLSIAGFQLHTALGWAVLGLFALYWDRTH